MRKHRLIAIGNPVVTLLFIFGFAAIAAGALLGVTGGYFRLFALMVITGALYAKIVLHVYARNIDHLEVPTSVIHCMTGVVVSVISIMVHPIYMLVSFFLWILLFVCFRKKEVYPILETVVVIGLEIALLILFLRQNISMTYFFVVFFGWLLCLPEQQTWQWEFHFDVSDFMKTIGLGMSSFYFVPMLYRRMNEGNLYTSWQEMTIVIVGLLIYAVALLYDRNKKSTSLPYRICVASLLSLLFIRADSIVACLMVLTSLSPLGFVFLTETMRHPSMMNKVRIAEIGTFLMDILMIVILLILYDGIHVDGSVIVMAIVVKLMQYLVVFHG